MGVVEKYVHVQVAKESPIIDATLTFKVAELVVKQVGVEVGAGLIVSAVLWKFIAMGITTMHIGQDCMNCMEATTIST